MSVGWRQALADVVTAIRGTLADAAHNGSISAADFLKLAGLPSSAVPTTRTIGTTAPLTGGGDLSADRTLAISPATALAPGSLAAADFSKLVKIPLSAAGPLVAFVGPTIDLTTTSGPTNVTIPDIGGGARFHIILQRLEFLTSSGTASGSNFTVNFLRNGVAFISGAAVTPSSFNSFAAPSTISISTVGPVVDPTTLNPYQYQVTSGVGGFASATGRIQIVGYYA
jgi:hypothetical protein